MEFPGQSLDGYLKATQTTVQILRARKVNRHVLSQAEGLLLQTILQWTREERLVYGLALVEALKGQARAIYPALHQLEKYGILDSEPKKIKRAETTVEVRLYTPTELGYEILEQFDPKRDQHSVGPSKSIPPSVVMAEGLILSDSIATFRRQLRLRQRLSSCQRHVRQR